MIDLRRDRAVFLDRDGVINRRRAEHVKSWADFEFLPGALTALARLAAMGRRVVVITNQAIVGRGLLSIAELQQIHDRMNLAVRASGGMIERVYVCPHLPGAGCRCRKPDPGLFLQASAELRLSLPASVMIGDTESDVRAARSAGCLPILITPQAEPETGVMVAADLMEAINLLESASHAAEALTC